MNQVKRIPHSFFKSTKSLVAFSVSLAVCLFVGTTNSIAATNLTWVSGSGDFATAGNWNPAQSPAAEDNTFFTNDTSITLSFSSSTPPLDSNTFSNHAGVVTLNLGANTWTVTNNFYVGKGEATSTVYVASGTLSVGAVAGVNSGDLRIGDPATNAGYNCVGALFVTNGTVEVDTAAIVGANSNGVGKLVITGAGVIQPTGLSAGNLLTVGNQSSGSQLIVTNGGKIIGFGTITVGTSVATSNNTAIFSGPTTTASMNFLRVQGGSGGLIVSNGAKITMTGSLLFGSAASFNTGIVVGAGTEVIVDGSAQFALGSAGATNNFFLVHDGAFISANGTMAYGNNQQNITNGLQIGGTGLMSTGKFTVVRTASNNTNHHGNFMIVTNAFVSCNYLNPQGPEETLSILANGTIKLTNSISIGVPAGNSNSVSFGGSSGATGGSLIMINRGTLDNLQTADNVGGISMGGNFGYNTLVVSNSGKLLTSRGTLGAAIGFNTGVVVGVGSVWSNFNDSATELIVGTGAGGSNNVLIITDGGRLYNDGTLNIGNNPAAVSNTVRFGGAGAASVIINSGSVNIGATTTNYGNILTVTNATLTCGALNVGNSGTSNNLLEIKGGTITVTTSNMVVRPTNTVLFTAGTLNTVGMRFDTNANNSNAFLVGDGTSAAFYIMANGGSGFHNFGNGGLVVTNGASLSGNGTLVRNVTVHGTFSPGLSVGTIIASNNLTFGSTAVLNYELGTNQDTVAVFGDLTLGGTINVTDSGGFTATTYTLFTITNTLSGPAGTLSVGTLPGGFSATVSTSTLGQVRLVVTGGGGDPYTTWLGVYGLTPGGNGLGTADPDGDGMINTNEFLAGFNPINSAARLRVISVVRSGSDVNVTYLGANGDSSGSPGPKTNVLEFTTGTGTGSYSNNFASTGQTNILSGGTGVGTVTNMIDVGGAAGATRYYRVRVLTP